MDDYLVYSNRFCDSEYVDFSKKEDLSLDILNLTNPRYIFFPYWSWIIPEEIWKNYECVVFHMTDLPYGRGGTPLQNLIIRGYAETKISALRVDEGLDTGDIYLKKPLDLFGSAWDIYERAFNIIISEMIPAIAKGNIEPIVQTGKVVTFERLSDNSNLIGKEGSLYDHIRMLDGPNLQKAYLDFDDERMEFFNAAKDGASVRFIELS